MALGPNEITIKEILINSLGSFIAGFVGSILILIMIFASSKFINMPLSTELAINGINNSLMFPILLSLITFIGTSITVFLTYYMLNLTSPEKYKKNLTILGQISFFGIFLYICIAPVYFYIGTNNYSEIINVFLIHIILLTFGNSIILEILNNYRYVLIGIYGSFMGLFISSIFTVFISVSFSIGGFGRLVLLISLLPVVNFLITFFKQFFELMYYHYNKFTNLDQLGDIFYQIEIEEKEKAKQL